MVTPDSDEVEQDRNRDTLGRFRQTLVVVPFLPPSHPVVARGRHRSLDINRTIRVSVEGEDLVQAFLPGQLVVSPATELAALMYPDSCDSGLWKSVGLYMAALHWEAPRVDAAAGCATAQEIGTHQKGPR